MEVLTGESLGDLKSILLTNSLLYFGYQSFDSKKEKFNLNNFEKSFEYNFSKENIVDNSPK